MTGPLAPSPELRAFIDAANATHAAEERLTRARRVYRLDCSELSYATDAQRVASGKRMSLASLHYDRALLAFEAARAGLRGSKAA